MRLIYLLFFLGASIGFADEAWDRGIQSLQEKKVDEAVASFKSFLESQEKPTSNAHYNLALAYWGKEDHINSSYHFLKSAEVAWEPGDALTALDSEAKLERSLGLLEPLSQSLQFRTHFALNSNVIYLMASLAFWSLVVCVFCLITRKFKPLPVLIALFLAFASLSSAIVMYKRNRPLIGILKSPESTISLYASSKAKSKVLELPRGTIVYTGQAEQGAVEILGPISGWVKSENVMKY